MHWEAAAAPGEGGVLLFEIRVSPLAPSKAAASREEPSREGMAGIMYGRVSARKQSSSPAKSLGKCSQNM